MASVAFGNAWNGPSLRVEQSDVIEPKKHEPKAQKGPLYVNLDEPELGTRVFAFWNLMAKTKYKYKLLIFIRA